MPKQFTSNLGPRFQNCKWGLRNKATSQDLTNQRTCSMEGKRVSKKSQQADAIHKPSSREEGKLMDSVRKEDEGVDTHQHQPFPLVNSGENKRKGLVCRPRKHKRRKKGYHGGQQSDSICIVCQYGGCLILCDHCPSSYHMECINLENVPDGKWFCPSCCCGLCGLRDVDGQSQLFTEVCDQCSLQYHVDCMTRARIGFPRSHPSEKFCSQNCFELCGRIHQLLGIRNPTSVDGLTWKLLRSTRNDCNVYNELRIDTCSELSQALNLMHECFEPIIEHHTKRDLIVDIVYNSVSKFKRLDFRGFYIMALQKDDEFVCAATVRIHGHKVAEMPLVATAFKYRRQGMCQLLVHELEKMLSQLHVERLVLPAISERSELWQSLFGFSEMSSAERLELLRFPFLGFQGTTMFQKILSKIIPRMEMRV
ncbi:increased DNA methylation 1 [Vitis riparia]|uniref:increased DNA methylation 1 n=1 Tax=Vitis riparia TaxID=96939 RepID=UPI00155AD52E|nr:increased DNA methylation 1 [Vitis riparia]XP_034683012.1 increased DNA methylation 1 [Vitis riparia]